MLAAKMESARPVTYIQAVLTEYGGRVLRCHLVGVCQQSPVTLSVSHKSPSIAPLTRRHSGVLISRVIEMFEMLIEDGVVRLLSKITGLAGGGALMGYSSIVYIMRYNRKGALDIPRRRPT